MRIAAVLPALLLIAPITAIDARTPRTVEQALAGRMPGKPTSCINQPQIDDTEIFDTGDILYRMKNGPDYLNTPSPRCAALRHDRGTISRTPSTSLCSGDILRVVDFTSHFDYGSCALGEFVPYPRVKKPKP